MTRLSQFHHKGPHLPIAFSLSLPALLSFTRRNSYPLPIVHFLALSSRSAAIKRMAFAARDILSVAVAFRSSNDTSPLLSDSPSDPAESPPPSAAEAAPATFSAPAF